MNRDNYSYARFYPKINGQYVALIHNKVWKMPDKLSVLHYGLNDQEDLWDRHGKDLNLLVDHAIRTGQKLTFEVEYEEHIYVKRSNVDIYTLEDLID